jgi:antitoxin (DNA-binding transcriptional repressor) of toxin-antitoxin stability system
VTNAIALGEKLLSLLEESARTTTYKPALLLALIDRVPGRTRIQRTPVALRRTGCYAAHVAREISVRDLRNHTAQVVAALRAGERLALTVNRTPVADIVPHTADRSPWVPSATLRRIVEEAAADAELLNDLADIRNSLIDQP